MICIIYQKIDVVAKGNKITDYSHEIDDSNDFSIIFKECEYNIKKMTRQMINSMTVEQILMMIDLLDVVKEMIRKKSLELYIEQDYLDGNLLNELWSAMTDIKILLVNHYKKSNLTMIPYTRKINNLLTILILPDFFSLPRGIALTYSAFLLDVNYYADEEGMFQRGFYDFYSRPTKKKLYFHLFYGCLYDLPRCFQHLQYN
jgi:hypothetical protein